MFSKALKIVGLIGGGILALGTGAVGSHLAQPHLEPLLNPERKKNEERLQQSLEDAEEKIKRLGNEFEQTQQINEQHTEKIISLQKDMDGLHSQIDSKNAELIKKNDQFEKKKAELRTQENLNSQQQKTISGLESQISEKDNAIKTETSNKEKAQTKLNYINLRKALIREDILTDKAIDESSLEINIREITWTGFDGQSAKFDVIDHESKKKSIKVKKTDKLSYAEKAEEIKRKGITFKLDSSFQTWNKVVKLTRFDIDYDYKATEEKNNRNFTKNSSDTEIELKKYFKNDYLEEAFKVFVAIVYLDFFPLCHNWSSTEENKPYLFCDNSDITQQFATEGIQKWPVFTETDASKNKFEASINRFKTTQDFISYWTKKTVDFVRTGTVDLFDFLNPIVISKNYTSS